MVSDRAMLNNDDLVRLVRYALKIDLTADDILKDVCKECESKVKVVDKWLKGSRKTETEYRALEFARKKIAFQPVRTKVVKDKPPVASEASKAVSLEVELMETKVEDPEDEYEQEQTIAQMEPTVESGDTNEDHDYAMEERLNDSFGNAHVVVSEEIITVRPLIPVVKKFNFPPNTHSKRGPQKRAKPKDTGQQMKYREYLSKKCHICDTVLDSPEDLVAHLTQKHCSGSPYKCTECGKSFKLITSYNRHLGFHDQSNRPLKCCYCPMGFKYNYSLLNHENRQHGAKHQIAAKKKPTEKAFQCTKCDKAFKTNYDCWITIDTSTSSFPAQPANFAASTSGTGRPCGNTTWCTQEIDHTIVRTVTLCFATPPVWCGTLPTITREWNGSTPETPVEEEPEEQDHTEYKCAICNEEFVTQAELVQHINVTHIGSV
nr:zinc finger protein 485-like [Aedes albopictus]